MNCSIPDFPVLHYLPEFAQTHAHWVRDAIQPFYPLSPPSPLALNLSQSGSFPMSQFFHQYWSFCISPSNEYSGLISFRIDWLDLLAVQGNLKSLLQHHHLKASVLQCSAFLMVQLSHLYMTTGKTTCVLSNSFVSDSLQPHGLQHTSLPVLH